MPANLLSASVSGTYDSDPQQGARCLRIVCAPDCRSYAIELASGDRPLCAAAGAPEGTSDIICQCLPPESASPPSPDVLVSPVEAAVAGAVLLALVDKVARRRPRHLAVALMVAWVVRGRGRANRAAGSSDDAMPYQ
eukprot:gene10678-2059_t